MTEKFREVRHRDRVCRVALGRGQFERIADLTSAWPKRFAFVGEGFARVDPDRIASLDAAGIETIVVPDGERAKTLAGVESIVTALLARGARRDATIIAVGGGVIGDMVGFAAAVFLRGVRLVHVPTTLLAQVDSSIGGKTAVNHAMGKNLIGAFHPAELVVSDVSVLRTLPAREILSGLFEALKSGVIGDSELFEICAARRDEIFKAKPNVLEDVVRRAVAIKAQIVETDERESDARKLLNYGHTIGHGIEAAAGYQGITHGEAVAWGMIAANDVAVRRGLLDEATARRIDGAILEIGPELPPVVDPDDIFAAVRHDKKFLSSGMVMVLPTAVGSCVIQEGIEEDEVRSGISAIARIVREKQTS